MCADVQVQRQDLRRRLADEDPELVRGPVDVRLEEDASAALASATDRLTAWLSGPTHAELLHVLAAGLPAGPRADDDAARLLPRRAARTWRQLQHAADACRGTSGDERDEALHELRKAARRARYASEVAALVVGAPARRSARRARRLQDVLGEQHDSVVRREVLRRLGRQASLDAEDTFTYGRLHALEQCAGERAELAARSLLDHALAPGHRRWAR